MKILGSKKVTVTTFLPLLGFVAFGVIGWAVATGVIPDSLGSSLALSVAGMTGISVEGYNRAQGKVDAAIKQQTTP